MERGSSPFGIAQPEVRPTSCHVYMVPTPPLDGGRTRVQPSGPSTRCLKPEVRVGTNPARGGWLCGIDYPEPGGRCAFRRQTCMSTHTCGMNTRRYMEWRSSSPALASSSTRGTCSRRGFAVRLASLPRVRAALCRVFALFFCVVGKGE